MRIEMMVMVFAALGILLSACTTPIEYDHVCTPDEMIAEACTMEYDPVCGDNDVTYSNGCVACSSGEIEAYNEGACAADRA